MFVRFFLLICSAVLLSGCTHSSQKQTTFPYHSSKQHRQVSDFTRVSVEGVLNVTLRTGYAHPQVTLKGSPDDLAHVVIGVTNGTLHVSLGRGYPKHGGVHVEIDSRYLNAFEYHGTGVIVGKHLHTRLLDVVIDNQGSTLLQGTLGVRKLQLSGSGAIEINGINSPALQVKLAGKSRVKLGGFANLSSLDLNNDSWVSMYWVKSKALTIRGHGRTFIQLAGIAEHLDVELWDNAHFNGRYLRAERSFVKTHGKSVAEIAAVKRQHTLATDTSDILFYNIPVMKADFMAFNGAVLDMRDLSQPYIQEYDQYNK